MPEYSDIQNYAADHVSYITMAGNSNLTMRGDTYNCASGGNLQSGGQQFNGARWWAAGVGGINSNVWATTGNSA
ncbi:MAG: hypothetical protein JWM34_5197 [Ilumatobacteraceae bacterium]|nr:hypothetical protein [Ilumatobacteraceae bacterium]